MGFLLQILPDFSGVQSEFDRNLIKMRSIFGIPLSCGKNGKITTAHCTKMGTQHGDAPTGYPFFMEKVNVAGDAYPIGLHIIPTRQVKTQPKLFCIDRLIPVGLI